MGCVPKPKHIQESSIVISKKGGSSENTSKIEFTKCSQQDGDVNSTFKINSVFKNGSIVNEGEEKRVTRKTDINPQSNIRSSQRRRSTSKSIKITSQKIITLQRSKVEDNYVIEYKVGQGSNGCVFKVKRKDSNLIRAMKVIKRKMISKENNSHLKFVHEIDILIGAHHPNILTIYEFYMDENNYYIITEFIEGTELYSTIVKFKRLSEEVAAVIFSQIISAIKYLHGKNIVHRDLKPENILVQKPVGRTNDLNNLYSIKIIDFGASNYYEKDQSLTWKIGSPYYIAPEVILKDYNEKCDLWSCGVILYILLTGTPPFKGKNPKEIMNNVLKGTYSLSENLFKNVSKEAIDLIKQLMTFDYENRISAEEAYEHPWLLNFRSSKESLMRSESIQEEYNNAIDNIMQFNAEDKLQQATLAYLVNIQEYNLEIQTLKKLFTLLDKDGSGRLTYDTLKNGFEQIRGKCLSDLEFNKVIEDIDRDQNGYIEYDEFLSSSVNKQRLLTEENLKIAFDNFDQEKKGYITFDEIRKILETNEDVYFEELSEKINLKSKGKLTYYEFKELMSGLLKKVENEKESKETSK